MLIARDPSRIIEEQHRIVQQIDKLARTEFGLTAIMDFAHRVSGMREKTEDRRPTKRRASPKKTPLSDAILKGERALQAGFTSDDVADFLGRIKFPLKQTKPGDAIGKALRKLRNQHKLIELTKGKGGAKSTYKFPG